MTHELTLTAPEPKQPTTMDLLALAMKQEKAIDVIERIIALRNSELERAAHVDFNEALARVQSEIKRIVPDLENPQKHNRYASYAAIDKVIRPIYSREGFALSFTHADCPKADHIRVLCKLSLRSHVETYQIDMPVDTKGPQGGDVMTRTHGTAAADSYAKRYLVKDIFNIAVGEDDQDGNALPDDVVIDRLTGIANCNSPEELLRVYKAAYKEASDNGDQNAMKAYIAAKDKRKKELANASH